MRITSLPLHDIFHIGEELKKRLLTRLCMERFEQSVSELNKMSSNSLLDDLFRFRQKWRREERQKKVDFKSASSSSNKWEELSFDYIVQTELEVKALLKELDLVGCRGN